jgi:hypothetical protein
MVTTPQVPNEEPRNSRDVAQYTGQQIADEFGVTRPTIYRHLAKATPSA